MAIFLDEIVAFFLGALSILSPCVLPLIPIIFASSQFKIKSYLMFTFGFFLSFYISFSIAALILSYLRFLAHILIFLLAIYLLSDRFELLVASKIPNVNIRRFPAFLYGFLLPAIWLPCITPFFGIAISAAALSDRPFAISLAYVAGVMFSIAIVLLLGERVKLDISKIKKPLGLAVLISLIYMLLG